MEGFAPTGSAGAPKAAPSATADSALAVTDGASAAVRDDAADAIAVAFDDAAFTYDGERFVFSDLSLVVPRGQFLAIIGGNGSGKSTIARCVNALLLPDRGRILVLGRATDDEDELYAIRSSAGMVFQNPDDQIVASVIENDVAFAPENLGVPSDELVRRVADALAAVGLAGFERHETHALSGGQKQRVAIAGVLAMEPEILILDEASAMLDPRGRDGLMAVCRTLNDKGLTIVMITHFMDEAARADRVIVLEDGRIALDGPPAAVLSETRRLASLSLEAPFAMRVATALRDAGVDVPLCLDEDALVDALTTLRSPNARRAKARR